MIGRLISVGGFTALSRIAGFFRDVLMAAILGAGPVSDAFMVAFRLPNNFRAIRRRRPATARNPPRPRPVSPTTSFRGSSRRRSCC